LDGNRDRLAAHDMGAYEFLPDEILSDLSLFPQVAVGGGYRTSLIAMNPGGQDAQVRWHLSDSNGSPVSEAVLVLNYNQPALSIPPLGFARVEVGAAGDTISGYAQLRGSIPINGAALLQMVGAGRVASEAAVGPATAVGQFIIYVDNTRGARSGYALANPSSVPANLNLTLRNKNGLQVANMIFRLPAGGHVAEFADERFAAAGIGFEGTIEFTGDQALHAVALRYDNEAGDAMSAIPVLADRLDSVLYFPQVADGADYRTNLILINPDDRSANVKLEFFAADGSPLSLPIGGTFQTKLNLTLDPKGCRSLLTDGIGTDIKAGWVRVTSSVPMGGSSVIQTRAGSKVGSEAGMSPSNAAKRFLAYLESRGYARSGVAICNPGAESVSLTLRLRNAAGEIVAARSLILPGLGQAARFFTDWFPLFDDFEGTLEVLCSTPVAAVALRYDNLLADVFAALPVVIIQ
jgi:hypothetical protein